MCLVSKDLSLPRGKIKNTEVRPSQTRHTDMQFFRSKTQDDIFNPIFSPKLSAMRWL